MTESFATACASVRKQHSAAVALYHFFLNCHTGTIELEETENEIAQLKRLIGGIYAYVERVDDENELCAGDGLKEAIGTALRSTSEDVTISEILGILKELQFPIEHHQNPLGSVYTTVTRLMEEGEVVAGETKDEKKTYRRARINLKIPPHKLSGILPVTFRDNKRRSR